MRKWTVRDRYGNQIYMTEERWRHIVKRHEELAAHFDDVLDAIRQGRRSQDAILPYKYIYLWPCDRLLPEYNRIVVIVIFKEEDNNFVVTAWPDFK